MQIKLKLKFRVLLMLDSKMYIMTLLINKKNRKKYYK